MVIPVDTARHAEAARELPRETLLIGGERYRDGSGAAFSHVNPATGQVQYEMRLAGAADVERAVAIARAAFEGWRRSKPARRAEVLNRLCELVARDKDRFALLSALENGMPANQFGGPQLGIIQSWLRYYAGMADKIEGLVTASWPAENLEYTLPEPLGVVAAIIPWNAPVISLAMKVPAALAAGNCVIVKPAEVTPFTAAHFVQLALEAGVPAGVLQLLPGGAEAGEALVRHPGVAKVSFTGGTVAARRVMAACAETLKPALYELGGKSANILFDDADLAQAIPYCAAFPMHNSGQGCQLPTRLLVHAPIVDAVVEGVRQTLAHLKLGDPLADDTFMGPVVSEAAMHRILADIERARVERAGALLAGGARADAPGWFVEPTVFAAVDPASHLAQNELFGPVLAILPFKDEDEAVAIANATPWGLAGYVQTRDLRRAHRVAARLVCGNVYVNGAMNVHPAAPFGGVGLSGFGKEGGRAGLEEFVRHKGVAIRLD
jgi:aldehyde dehydrogenase (NAD+)